MARPGSLNPRFRTVAKAEAAAVQAVETLGSAWLSRRGPSKTVPKPSSAAVLQAGRLLDFYVVRQIPLSPTVLTALMTALRVEPQVRRIEAAAEARAWSGKMGARELAEATGFSERQIYAWRKAAPIYPQWATNAEAVLAARSVADKCRGTLGEAKRYPSPDGALTIYAALRHHNGLPIPEGLWWCALCAMGLADYRVGLLEATIEGTRGTLRHPEALHLMARWDAERDHAGKPRRTDAEMLRKLRVHFADQPRMVPKRSTVVRYRAMADYEDHVAEAAVYCRVRARAEVRKKNADDEDRRVEDRLRAENRRAWLALVAADKAGDVPSFKPENIGSL